MIIRIPVRIQHARGTPLLVPTYSTSQTAVAEQLKTAATIWDSRVFWSDLATTTRNQSRRILLPVQAGEPTPHPHRTRLAAGAQDRKVKDEG